MDTVLIVIIIAIVLAVGVAVVVRYRRRRSDRLRQRFGPEYERALEESDHKGEAEKELRSREKRRSAFEITPLTGQDATRYSQEWADIRLRFVDQPAEAVARADRLVIQMMRDRGYPVDDFEQRVDDISVDHPEVAQHYREAHARAIAQAADSADTEQLRQAVTSYGQLVHALLSDNRRPNPPTNRVSSDEREHA